MKKALTLLFSFLTLSYSFAQENAIDKGDFLLELGALPPFSINAKLAVGILPNAGIGIFAERHAILSERSEAGIFARKYLTKKRLNFYLQGAVSYAHFRPWNFDNEIKHRPLAHTSLTPYSAVKLNGGGGISFRLTEQFKIGNEAVLGFTAKDALASATFLFTANYTFKSSLKKR